jgi:hypothetical protein
LISLKKSLLFYKKVSVSGVFLVLIKKQNTFTLVSKDLVVQEFIHKVYGINNLYIDNNYL